MSSKISKNLISTLAALLAVLFAFLALRIAYGAFNKRAYPVKYKEAVVKYSDENALPYDLVFAVIHTESGFRPNVESEVGARGLMQLTEETFDWTKSKMSNAGDESYEEMFDPVLNIKYGTHLLRLLIDEFESTDTALCAYHAGWGNAKKWLKNPEHSADGVNIHSIPFGDTKKYVAGINKTRGVYRAVYGFAATGQ
ncbi:MAG: lytic transglycosylase domain-containing protein [Hydrogenoanaerobacterium sp.]